jgi:hypothetical protein
MNQQVKLGSHESTSKLGQHIANGLIRLAYNE